MITTLISKQMKLNSFIFYSSGKKGWFCWEYGEVDFRCTKYVNLYKHPPHMISNHALSKTVLHSLSKQKEIKVLLEKRSINKQLHNRADGNKRNWKKQNRSITKKPLMTTYFIASKKGYLKKFQWHFTVY